MVLADLDGRQDEGPAKGLLAQVLCVVPTQRPWLKGRRLGALSTLRASWQAQRADGGNWCCGGAFLRTPRRAASLHVTCAAVRVGWKATQRHFAC